MFNRSSEYIPLEERAKIVDAAKAARVKNPPVSKPISYPGFQGTPSELPDGPKKRKAP